MTAKEAWGWLGKYKLGGDWNRMPIAEIEMILDSFSAVEIERDEAWGCEKIEHARALQAEAERDAARKEA